MDLEPGARLFLIVLALLGGALILSLLGGVFLRAAAKWAENLDLTYGSACKTALLPYLINFGVGLTTGFALATSAAGRDSQQVLQLLSLPLGFLIQTAMISWRHSLTFGKALEVSCLMAIIGVLFFIVTAGVFVVILGATEFVLELTGF